MNNTLEVLHLNRGSEIEHAYLFYALTDAVKEIMRCEEFEEQL